MGSQMDRQVCHTIALQAVSFTKGDKQISSLHLEPAGYLLLHSEICHFLHGLAVPCVCNFRHAANGYLSCAAASSSATGL